MYPYSCQNKNSQAKVNAKITVIKTRLQKLSEKAIDTKTRIEQREEAALRKKLMDFEIEIEVGHCW